MTAELNTPATCFPPTVSNDQLRALLLQDYQFAVIHLALNRNSASNLRTLLFAWVELVPAEIPPPVDDYVDNRKGDRLGSKSSNAVYVRHTTVSAAWALDWYLQARSGRVVWPRKTEDFESEPDEVEEQLDSRPLSELPAWPRLATHSEETTALPFVGGWMECPRTHHLITIEPMSTDALWTDSEYDKAIVVLSSKLHFSLEQYPELLGSVHLIAPNPVYRGLRSALRVRRDGESSLMRFQPRTGMSVENLVLRFQERAPWGPKEIRVIPGREGIIRLDFDHVIDSVREEVLDSVRGILQAGDATAFYMRSVETTFSVDKRVKVQARKPEDSFNVSRSGEPQTSIMGTPAIVGPAEKRLVEAWYTRAAATRTAAGKDQRWLRGKQKEARRLMIDRIQSAHRLVMIADPYFGPDELVLAEAVRHSRVKVLILTSKNLFDVWQSTSPLWTMLLSELRARQANLPHNSVEVRVLGRKALHDRFLLVDDTVWSLGGSLNKLGERGSLVHQVHDSESMVGVLRALWDDATPIEKVIEEAP